MAKNKYDKIPISEFISDKKLSKILSIIQKSDDVETNYDRIEMLLDDDYEVKDLGTNRLVLLHKKNKYKNLIFKVAGDSHGIEANYREFYNGDLDKRLTFSYSISKDGTFIVQERVKPLTRDLMKKYKKDVREMLTKLSKKLLLVDCKIENFKNFGIRSNGDICLLDHGDTVPLPNYQGNDIVNINEESFVSLRCKKPEEMSVGKNKLKACGGKLKYSKNFDYLVCEECGGICTVNDAYREFYGDKTIKIKGKADLDLDDSFDPDEWKAHIQKYCIETMSHANNNINNKKGELTMKTKTIKNRNCIQVKGFWLPEPTGELGIYAMLYASVKMGKEKPQKYLETLGLNIDDYKVYPYEHTPSEKPKKKMKNENSNEYDFNLFDVRDKIVNYIMGIGRYQSHISYITCARLVPEVDFSNIKNIQAIREVVSSDKRTAGCRYDEEGFSVRLSERYITHNDEEDENYTEEEENLIEEAILNNEMDVDREDELEEVDLGDDYPEEHDQEEYNRAFISGMSIVDSNNNENDIEYETTMASDNVDPDDLVREYASNNNTTIIEDTFDEDYTATRSKLIFSYEELEDNSIDYNGVKCVVINKYAVPINIIHRYSNDDGFYELPSHKMKALLKANGLHPKKYKITNTSQQEEFEDISTESESINENEAASVYNPDEYDSDRETFIIELNKFINKYAEENNDKIDRFGIIEIPAAEIIVECLLNHVDNGEVVPLLSRICDITEEDSTISIDINYDQLTSFYKFISKVKNCTDISCNYLNASIGFIVSNKEFNHNDIPADEQYKLDIESVKNDIDNIKSYKLPISCLDPSSYFNEDQSDPISEKHKVFNNIINSLDDIFSIFYTDYNDDKLPSLEHDDEDLIDITEVDSQQIDICNTYKMIKRDVFNTCETLEEFYNYLLGDERIFGIIITTALIMSEFSNIMDYIDSSYETLKQNTDKFMTYIGSIKKHSSHDSDSDSLDDVNSYIEDNNTNNKDEIATYSEESDEEEEKEILTQKVLDAILELTKAVNSNSEIMDNQNELMTRKLISLENKLDALNNITEYASTIENEMDIEDKIHNSDDEIVMLSEEDLDKKIIAVNIDDTTVCFNILDLARKSIETSEPSDYLSVTDVVVTNL